MIELSQIKEELKRNVEAGMGQIAAVEKDLDLVKSRLTFKYGHAYIRFSIKAKLITPFDEEYEDLGQEVFEEEKEKP
jgi:hypothetical protein